MGTKFSRKSVVVGWSVAVLFLLTAAASTTEAAQRSYGRIVVFEIKRFDVYQAVNDLVADPEAHDLDVVNAACVTPNRPPFHCQKPEDYLFWDGIHPTKAGQAILAQEVADALAQ